MQNSIKLHFLKVNLFIKFLDRLKFFKFESGTNFLEQYYLKDQQLFFE